MTHLRLVGGIIGLAILLALSILRGLSFQRFLLRFAVLNTILFFQTRSNVEFFGSHGLNDPRGSSLPEKLYLETVRTVNRLEIQTNSLSL